LDELKELGNATCRLFKEYEVYRDSGNEHLDIREVLWDKDVADLVTAKRENGIEHFTFSSTWSSTVETARLFQQNGCKLEGLIEINSNYTK
jgi:hypothetical protein